jgi:hypothetical protein
MRKLILSVFIFTAFCAISVHAEKVIMERTIEKTWTGFAVDEQGTIIKYAKNIVGGKLESVSYLYRYGKNGKKQIDWTGVITKYNDFEPDAVDCQIVGLAKKNVLLLFTRENGTSYYVSARMSKKELKFRGEIHETLTGEICWINKSRIYSLTTSGDKTSLRTFSLKFKEKLESKRVIGIGTISAINPNIQKFYQDVSGGPLGTSDVHVRIVKP